MDAVTVDHPKFKRIQMDFDTYMHEIQEARESGRRNGVFEFLRDLEALLTDLSNKEISAIDKRGFEREFYDDFELKGPLLEMAMEIIYTIKKERNQ